MKNSIEIRQERATVIENANTLLNLAKDEARDFTADEQVSYDGMMENIDKLAKDIEVVERQEKLNAEAASIPVSHQTQKISDTKEARSFSFAEAVNAAKTGRVEGLIREMDQEARSENPNQDFKGVAIPYSVLESRGANTALTAGSNPVEVKSFVDEMFFASTLIPAGANFYSGVSASQKIPILDGIQVDFVAEDVGTAVTPAGTIEHKQLDPKTCIASTSVSAAALSQNASIEAAFRSSMAKGVMSELERQLLANGAGTGVSSFFQTAFVGTEAGPTDWGTADKSVECITEMLAKLIVNGVDDNNDNIKLLMNGTAYADLLDQINDAGGSAYSAGTLNLFERRVMNIPYFVSQAVGGIGANATTKARALLLDITKVHMAMFGGLDLLVDPYSNSLFGGTNMVMTTLLDGTLAGVAGKEVAVNAIEA